MRELSEDEDNTRAEYLMIQDDLIESAKFLVIAFSGYKQFLIDHDYQGAKEFLRPMPDSAEKVLIFREIILAHEEHEYEKMVEEIEKATERAMK